MLEKYFPTFEDVEQNLSQEAIQGLYLKLAEYAEAEAEESKNFFERKQINEKLLNIYLALLEFEDCPDRDAINFNCGILFFLSGCPINAYAFFERSTKNFEAIANIIGLTFAHLDEFSTALMYLEYACDQEP